MINKKWVVLFIVSALIVVSGCSPSTIDPEEYFRETKTSKHFSAHYPKSQARHVDNILYWAEKAYRELILIFPDSQICSTEVWVVKSVGDSNKITGNENPNWLRGMYNERGGSITVIDPKDLSRNRYLDALVKHELSHLFIIEAADYNILCLPAWLNEGLAQYLTYQRYDGPGRGKILMKAVEENKLLSLSDLRSNFGQFKDGDRARLAYDESLNCVEYLAEQYGFKKIIKLLHLRGKSVILEEAFPQAFGVGYAEFEKNWKKYIKEEWLKEWQKEEK